MTGISKNLATEIADGWENMAATEVDAHPKRRETLRECADLLRMLSDLGPLQCPRAARLHSPMRFCPDCPGAPGDGKCELPKDDLASVMKGPRHDQS